MPTSTPMFGSAPPPAAPGGNPVNSTVKLDSGYGAYQPAQQAWMSRVQPQMDRQRQAEMARLKSQGITENSDVWGRSMDTLNRNQVDANNQGWMYGAQEAGNVFNRGLAQNNQVFGQNLNAQQLALALRGQQFDENKFAQNNPYQQMMWLNSMQQGQPQFSGTGQGTNYTGAGTAGYLGNLGNYNAKTAANNGMISGIGQLLGGAGQSAINNPNASSGVGGMLSGIGDLWKFFGGWGG